MPLIPTRPTQDFIPIREIRDGVLILNDGSLRAILLTTAVNFALKSSEEQEAIIFQFQNFLNSLDFSIQIFMESRRLDIKPYILALEERYRAQTNDLMRTQSREYINFIKTFAENTNIMKKSFFIIVPYSPPSLTAGKTVSSIKSVFGGAKKTEKEDEQASKEDFEENLSQLMQRVSAVEQGARRMGIHSAMLGTEETTELFYKIFNPGETEQAVNQ